MNESVLLVQTDGPLRRLTLNRPARRNALTPELALAMAAAVEEADRDPAVRCIVIEGSGGHFCSGLDLQAVLSDHDPSPESRAELVEQTLVRALHPAVRSVWASATPTLAALTGATVGVGLSLALAADLRVMSQDAYLSTQFLARGLYPDGGCLYLLERLAGLGRTLDLTLQPGRRVRSSEAEAWGLASRVGLAGALDSEVLAVARQLADGAPVPQRSVKQALKDRDGFEAALRAEVPLVTACLSSADAMEGAMAFLEKRPPHFSGR